MHDPAALDAIEQRYLRDLWRLAEADTVAERRIDLARFGPVQAAIVCEEPAESLVNVVLGAGAWGAVEGGYLADAVDWVAAHGVDYRVSVTPRRLGSRLGEHWLMERGHEQGLTWVKFARDTSVSAVEESRDVEVFEARGEEEICEGFIQLADESFWGARWLGSCFSDLVEMEDWHCYVAYGKDDLNRSSGAVMLTDGNSAELGPLLCDENEDVELQEALIRRCVRDAAAAGCRAIFAEAESSESGDGLSSAAETLLAAGFRQVFTRTDWRPPRPNGPDKRAAWTPFGAGRGRRNGGRWTK
jgi:hypothetical protein